MSEYPLIFSAEIKKYGTFGDAGVDTKFITNPLSLRTRALQVHGVNFYHYASFFVQYRRILDLAY